ncbi:Metalloenzyme, LuxS/M16 peptidase-like protein [Zopfochytrium polystomum]|nr:Metalloenzyme, LuxS/M16 peptidase-like protein [Zopfochytrium polystomum]
MIARRLLATRGPHKPPPLPPSASASASSLPLPPPKPPAPAHGLSRLLPLSTAAASSSAVSSPDEGAHRSSRPDRRDRNHTAAAIRSLSLSSPDTGRIVAVQASRSYSSASAAAAARLESASGPADARSPGPGPLRQSRHASSLPPLSSTHPAFAAQSRQQQRLQLHQQRGYRRSFSTLAATGAHPTLISTLPNGIRVASQDAPGHFVAAGVYVDVGSRYETADTAGACHVLDRLAFKSTQNFTNEEMLAQLETLGGNVIAHSSREALIYQAAVFRKNLPKVIEILAEVSLRPLITDEEVLAVKDTIAYEIEDMKWRPDIGLPEKLQQIAFGGLRGLNTAGQTLLLRARQDDTSQSIVLDEALESVQDATAVGRAMLCTPSALEKITPELLRSFHKTWYTPERLVVAGVGMPHEELVALAEQHFGQHAPAAPETLGLQVEACKPSKYTGGSVVVDTSKGPISPNPDDQNLTHLFIGFEAPSLLDPDVYALATLSTLMGGGGSFSAGGPGKGMYTRLYTEVLNQYHWVERCNMVSFSYLDTGLFGIYAAVPPSPETHEYIGAILCHQLYDMTRRIAPIELSRAKNQLKSNLLMSLESRSVELEDIGRQVMSRPLPLPGAGAAAGPTAIPPPPPRRVGVEEMCRRVDSLTAEDLMRVARRVLFCENVQSPLEFEGEGEGGGWRDHPARHWRRSGDGGPTVLAVGALTGPKDALRDPLDTVRKWRLGEPVDAPLASASAGGSGGGAGRRWLFGKGR